MASGLSSEWKRGGRMIKPCQPTTNMPFEQTPAALKMVNVYIISCITLLMPKSMTNISHCILVCVLFNPLANSIKLGTNNTLQKVFNTRVKPQIWYLSFFFIKCSTQSFKNNQPQQVTGARAIIRTKNLPKSYKKEQENCKTLLSTSCN